LKELRSGKMTKRITPKEAAFETATGKWAQELGYTDVILNPSDVQGIIDGTKLTIAPIFVKFK